MATLIGNGAHASDIKKAGGVFIARVISHHEDWTGFSDNLIIGVNDPRLRAQISERLGIYDRPWIHPHAHLGHHTTYGFGTHINYGVTMTRTRLGNHVTVSPGVTICGDVTIGDRVLVGAGATICDRVTIGDDVTVGAGAVVLPETVIPNGETWVGVPARNIR